MAEQEIYFAGLDIGGTTVKSVLVNARGELVGTMVEVRSHVKDGVEATFGQLDLALEQLIREQGIHREQIRGIGLDVPAPSSEGVVWTQANLSADWVGKNIRERLSAKYGGLPVYMTNDGNAAALGEYAVRPDYTGSLMLVAPGTGLAGGFVLPGGRAWEGANGLALEVGHLSVPHREDDGTLPPCSCGKLGCLEAWVSLTALRRRVVLELAKPEYVDHRLQGEGSAEEKAFRLREFAEAGDAFALAMFRQQAGILGHGLADLVRLFDPGLVVISGGLAEVGFRDQYLEWIVEGFKERAWDVYLHSPIDPAIQTTVFEWATGGDAAAALGVAFAAQERFGGGE